MLCNKCDKDVVLDNWSEYDQMCDECSYAIHREEEENKTKESVRQAREVLNNISEDDISQIWSMPTLSNEALEAFIASINAEQNSTEPAPAETRSAARIFLGLTRLVLLEAPPEILSQQIDAGRRACGL